MSHVNREDQPGRVFHVTSRVNWRAWHLGDDKTKRKLAALINEAAASCHMRIWAVVIVDNHFHGVFQSPTEPVYRQLTGRRTRCRHFRPWPKNHQNSSVMAQFMRSVRRKLSVWRQKELGLSGRFWESDYDARVITDPYSLLVRIAYDHRNPTKAKIVTLPEEYEWSSAREWTTGEPGVIPLSLPGTLPFGLRLDEFRREIVRYQTVGLLDDLGDELEELFARPDDAGEALRNLLSEHGLSIRGIGAAEYRRNPL